MRPITLFCLLVVLIALGGCEQPPPDVTARNRAPRALVPGDPDYPIVNPTPKQLIAFTAIVPATLSHDFHLKYFVVLNYDDSVWGSFVTSPHECRWTKDNQFFVDQQIALKQSGTTYTGHFAQDHFLPGACGWHLSVLLNPDYNSGQTGWGERAVVFFVDRPFVREAQPPIGERTAYSLSPHLSIWCTRQSGQLFCTSFGALESLVPHIPQRIRQSVPQRDDLLNIEISPYATSLTIEFHDFDALVRDDENRR